MLSPSAMRKLRICVMERDAGRVAEVLGRLGVVHLTSSMEEGEGRLAPGELDDVVEACARLRDRLDALMARLDVAPPEHVAEEGHSADSLDSIRELVEALEESTAALTEELTRTETALADAAETGEALAPFRDLHGPLLPLAESDLVELSAGQVPRPEFARLRATLPAGILLIAPGEQEGVLEGRPVEVLACCARRRRFAMQTVLEEHGFEPHSLPRWSDRAPADLHAEAVTRKGELAATAAELRTQLQEAGRPRAAALRRAYATLAVQMQLYEAQRQFATTWATAVISGWVPAERTGQVEAAVMEATDGRVVIETAEPDAEDLAAGRVPSRPLHSRFFAPFSRLVTGYGVAGYSEVEPTVMFAVSFLLMFGIIFGDLGHGACLVLIGLMVAARAKRDAMRDAGRVMMSAGAASALFGAFFQGAFFGKSLADMGFPLTLGFEPIRFEGPDAGAGSHVVRYLLLAMAFGVVLISIGAIVNVVNRLRQGDYRAGLLSRFGVVGIFFYWGALALGIKVVVAGAGSADPWLAAGLVALPLVVLVLQEPLYLLLIHDKPITAEGLMMGLFHGLVEALEAVMTYVANTLSFLRMAAFALSHAALCYTIFILQRMVNDLPGGPIWQACVFIIGTALIIGLEGLIVTIQIMRLEYYEFFGKFFRGDGVPYTPFRLE